MQLSPVYVCVCVLPPKKPKQQKHYYTINYLHIAMTDFEEFTVIIIKYNLKIYAHDPFSQNQI